MKHERILGVYAHPDDADIGAGGTLAHFAAEGADVAIVVTTLGDAGGYEEEGHDRISEVRRQEQLDAASALGIEKVTFLEGYADGDVTVTKELVRDIVRQIRTHQPTLVLTMSPVHNWNSVAATHPDHRAVGEATVQAVYPAARNPFAFPELLEAGLEPWTVEEIWFQGHQDPNSHVELTKEDVESKVEAVSKHISQFQDLDRMRGHVLRMVSESAAESGLPEGSFAERFFVYKTN
ncbi:MAG: PIG-L deacetylase family protein [Scrofimicrobium sp.]